jgi:cyclic pyranopterin phosphate synthase
MIDPCGRTVDYLRVLVTDRCNLRCLYCIPEEGVSLRPRADLLTLEEIHRVVSVGLDLGIRKVRLTGGEPLMRANIEALVEMLAGEPLLSDLAMTTNGILLSRRAFALREAGLKRINISLNTLRPERFERIARRGGLEDVLAGIERSLEAGFDPVKINVVLLRGLNDDEIPDMARLAKNRPLHVRFIELMDLGAARALFSERFSPVDEARAAVERYAGPLVPVEGSPGAGPSEVYSLDGFLGTVGFIGNREGLVCARCNRLRLTADGCLKTCLHSAAEFCVKHAFDTADPPGAIRASYLEAVAARMKDKTARFDSTHRTMSQIGG